MLFLISLAADRETVMPLSMSFVCMYHISHDVGIFIIIKEYLAEIRKFVDLASLIHA